MKKSEYLQLIEQNQKKRRKHQLAIIDIDNDIQLLRASVSFVETNHGGEHVRDSAPSNRTPKQQAFINTNYDYLSDDDFEFLGRPGRTADEVAEYLGVSSKSVRNRLNEGIYSPFEGDSLTERVIDAYSVIQALIDGKAKATA